MRAPNLPETPYPSRALLLALMLLLTRGLHSEPLSSDPGAGSVNSLELSSSEAEAEVELEAETGAAEPPEGCCVRQPRMEALHDGEGGSVDVGHCSRSCRHSVDADADASDEACPGVWQCEASRMELRAEAAVGGGVREMRVVEGCACRARAAPCARRPLALRIFPDTPFETTVDVGTCSGHCGHDEGCRAVQRRSVAVQGPNGARCVPVVERCACAAACYRVRRLQVVRDYAGEDGALLTHPVLKEVDVGACEGACESAAAARRCADPFWRAGSPCRSWLVESRSRIPATCAAAATSTRRYTARDGERRRLVVVERCGCK